MSVRLVENPVNKLIPVQSMKDGDIAVITCWDSSVYIGRVVQRYYNNLICVGSNSRNGWSDIFSSPVEKPSNQCRVRLLEKGETLIIE